LRGGSRFALAVSGFRLRARLDCSIPACAALWPYSHTVLLSGPLHRLADHPTAAVIRSAASPLSLWVQQNSLFDGNGRAGLARPLEGPSAWLEADAPVRRHGRRRCPISPKAQYHYRVRAEQNSRGNSELKKLRLLGSARIADNKTGQLWR